MFHSSDDIVWRRIVFIILPLLLQRASTAFFINGEMIFMQCVLLIFLLYILLDFLKWILFAGVSFFSLHLEHDFEGARLTALVVLTFVAFAKICAVNALLVALAILLLAVGLFAIAPFEVSLFFVAHGQGSKGRRLGWNAQQYFALLLQVDLINL